MPKSKENNLIFSVLLAIIVLTLIIVAGLAPSDRNRSSGLEITTEMEGYDKEDLLKVKIVNKTDKDICFSSCYPYYLEREKEEGWKSYSYSNCSDENLAVACIVSKDVKAFELVLPPTIEGSHRLAIPICYDCDEGDNFEAQKKFYSNEFIIN